MEKFDYIIVGSGIAGLSFALKAATAGSVAVVTKRAVQESNTHYAQGGVACVTSEEDSFELHVRDTLQAGAELCDESVVRQIVAEAPERIQELIDIGVHFDQREDDDGNKELDLGREGGHSKRRILHARDITGREIERSLIAAVRAHKNIHLLEDHMAVDLITTAKLGYVTGNRCVGLYVLDEASGKVLTLRTDRVILATGGCGKVYLYTTNPAVATGDGVAMAWRAGATIANMEFVQFHPTCLYHPDAGSFLISEALRGEGGRLINAKGQPFTQKHHPLGDLAPRDIVARAIDAEMKKTGERCVFLDISHKSREFILERFPNIYEHCLAFGIDITQEPIPVVPAAHYQCGGVKASIDGRTSLVGLYVIGEAACTGLHGANRLASNSLLEGLVMAHRAHEALLRERPTSRVADFTDDLPPWQESNVADVDELVVIYHNWDEIRRLMWDYVGIVRTDKRLHRAGTRLRNLQREVQEFYWNFKVTTDLLELRNLVTAASLIVDSALARKESRGLHYTLDYPETDDLHYRRDTLIWRS